MERWQPLVWLSMRNPLSMRTNMCLDFVCQPRQLGTTIGVDERLSKDVICPFVYSVVAPFKIQTLFPLKPPRECGSDRKWMGALSTSAKRATCNSIPALGCTTYLSWAPTHRRTRGPEVASTTRYDRLQNIGDMYKQYALSVDSVRLSIQYSVQLFL